MLLRLFMPLSSTRFAIFWQRIRPFVIHSYDPRDGHFRRRRRRQSDTFGAIIAYFALTHLAIHSPALCELGFGEAKRKQKDPSFDGEKYLPQKQTTIICAWVWTTHSPDNDRYQSDMDTPLPTTDYLNNRVPLIVVAHLSVYRRTLFC